MSIEVGCCGFPTGKKRYFREFELVEVQQTFYDPPSAETARKWRENAPPGFEFSMKAWQVITHSPSSPTYRKAGLRIPIDYQRDYGLFQPSEKVSEAWTRTRNIAKELKAKVIVFQCPASFVPCAKNVGNMKRFFSNIDREGFVFVWEPRGEWVDNAVRELCRDLDLVRCVNSLENAARYEKLQYFRLHGGRDYRHRYTDDELVRLWELSSDETYVLFNNVTMYCDALGFQKLLRGAH